MPMKLGTKTVEAKAVAINAKYICGSPMARQLKVRRVCPCVGLSVVCQ
jgi:hypothetical protein